MRLELKKAIIDWIFENINEFQIVNVCCDKFREYIYNKEGKLLIGGAEVYNFIREIIPLIQKEM